MAKPELGQKQICPNDQTKFYDLGRRPAVCPKCGFSFDPEEVVRSRKVRSRAPDYEGEEEKEDQVADVNEAADDTEDEDDAEKTPEVDQADDAVVIDDEDSDEDASPGVGFTEAGDDEDSDEDGDDVPFLEDDDDDDFSDDDIDVGGDDEEEER